MSAQPPPPPPKRLNIPLYIARQALCSPAAVDVLVDSLGDLTVQSIENLEPLVFDVLALGEEFPVAQLLERMLAKRPEWVNLKNKEGDNLLLEALISARFDLLDMLIAAGVDPTHENKSGFSVLDAAAAVQSKPQFTDPKAQESFGNSLLENGDFSIRQKDEALKKAACGGNLGMSKSLLAHGAGFSTPCSNGTLLALACSFPESEPYRIEIIQLLLQTPGAYEIINSGWGIHACSPMHYAAKAGNVRLMSMLMEAGARVDPPRYLPKPSGCKTPLMNAASEVQVEAMDLLIKSGCDATALDRLGQNAFHHLGTHTSQYPVYVQHSMRIQAINLLLDAGTDPFLKNRDGQTPLDHAMKRADPEVIDLFRSLVPAQASSRQLSNATPDPGAIRQPPARRL